MALETIQKHFGKGGARLSAQVKGHLFNSLRELQGFRVDVIDGVDSTDATLTGITPEDTLVTALSFPDSGVANDVSAYVSIKDDSDNTLVFSDDYGGDKIMVIWYDKSEAHSDLNDLTPYFGKGGARLSSHVPRHLFHVLRELQGFRVNVVAGAAANTDITLTGAKVGDVLAYVWERDSSNSWTDRTSVASIADDDDLQLSEATTGDTLFVFWYSNADPHDSMVPLAPYFGKGGAKLSSNVPNSLVHVLTELQGLNMNRVGGAGANVEIALSGITTKDTLVGVLEDANGDYTDRLSETSISSDGNIRCSTVTSGDTLLVFWFDKEPA